MKEIKGARSQGRSCQELDCVRSELSSENVGENELRRKGPEEGVVQLQEFPRQGRRGEEDHDESYS